jgi:dipeptidyl aminopeptidase/acylaminoacyl peptidase
VLVDVAARRIERTMDLAAGTRSSAPAWSPDGRTLYFASAPAERPFAIHSLDLTSGAVSRLANAGESAQSPDVSPDGTTLVFVGYTVSGFDLFSLSLSQARWETVERSVSRPAGPPPSVASAATAFTSSSYNPLKTLAPRFWRPGIETSDDEVSVGATTGGIDALGRHSYVGGVSWSTRARPDWFGGYAYDRWRPTFFADVSDDTDPWREGTSRTTEFNAGAVMWFRRVRRSQLLFGSFHGATETFDCALCSPVVDATFKRRALRAAWSFDASRTYGYSISDEEGFSITTLAEWTAESLGSTGDATATIADARAFIRLGPRHAVIAMRAAGATAWGDQAVRRQFAPGGAGPADSLDFDRDAIALVRGFDSDDLSGRRAVVINVDYRFPLLWVEKGVGTWPLFLRSLHGAAFTDFGAAWETSLSRSNRRASAGFELASDVVLGFSFPLTAAAGVAWRHDPTGRSDGATLFWRIGRAF